MASIQKREGRNKPYRVRYRDPKGKQRSKSFRTKALARDFKTKVESQVREGDYLDPDKGKVTFSEVADRWTHTVDFTSKKARTQKDRKGILRSRVLPTFGELAVASIERGDVVEWMAGMRDEGLSASRIRNCLNVVKWVLEEAKLGGNVRENVARGIKNPKDQTDERIFLNAEQVEALAEAIKPRFRALVYVLAYGGLRWGEAAALRRRHIVQLPSPHIEIRETVVEVPGEGRQPGTPKNHQRRKVYLPGFAWRELMDHIEARVADAPDALLFATEDTEMPFYNKHFREDYFDPAVAMAGLPEGLRLHDLRHTCASLWNDLGASVVEIQQQLGHSKPSTTLDIYTHLFNERPDGVLAALDAHHRKTGEEGTSRVAQMWPKEDDGPGEAATG